MFVKPRWQTLLEIAGLIVCRLRRKQGEAVGAVASRMQGPLKGRSRRWVPQPETKQQPTGLIACRLRAAALFVLRKIKNDPKHELGAIFYAGEGGRTLTPLELVPKTSASAIPPLPHGNFIYSSKIRGKSQLPKDNSLFASA